MLREDVAELAELVHARGLAEEQKPEDRSKLAGRIRLLHDCLRVGIAALRAVESSPVEIRESASRREPAARR